MATPELPPGTNVISISPSGASYWARTAKIEATDANGDESSFFVKVSVVITLTRHEGTKPT
jgi:hypothetical protein